MVRVWILKEYTEVQISTGFTLDPPTSHCKHRFYHLQRWINLFPRQSCHGKLRQAPNHIAQHKSVTWESPRRWMMTTASGYGCNDSPLFVILHGFRSLR